MIKQSIIYLTASLASKAVPFLLLPILTVYLTPSEFGYIALFQVLFTVSQALYGGINVNISRTYFTFTENRYRTYLSAVLFVMLVQSLLILVIYPISYFSFPPIAFLQLESVIWFPVVCALGMSYQIYLTELRTKSKATQFAYLEFGLAGIGLGLSLYLIMQVELGWLGRLIGILLPLAIFGSGALIKLIKSAHYEAKFFWHDVKDTFTVSFPLVPHVIAATALSSMDRIFIEQMLGIEKVGIYTVGYQFGMVVMLFTDAFLKAWQPWFFKTLHSDNPTAKSAVVRYTYYYLIVLSVGAFCYGLIASWLVPFVIGEQFHSATSVILPVCLGYVAFGAYQIFFPYLVHAKKTIYLVAITPVAALVNGLLNYWAIPIYGIEGAAYATIGAYIISAILVFVISTKLVQMPWNYWTLKILK